MDLVRLHKETKDLGPGRVGAIYLLQTQMDVLLRARVEEYLVELCSRLMDHTDM